MCAMTRSLDKFNLRISLVDGVNTTTATLTGIATEDEIVSVLLASTKAAVATIEDITSTVSITAASTITVTADYTNDLMIVFWIDKSV
uniref:Uncharacterized protein n=1 Tax=viral metagenome TaxID=1070528 RepID=A0A6M3JT62_9ZZZZ